jgi:hypothetical protein
VRGRERGGGGGLDERCVEADSCARAVEATTIRRHADRGGRPLTCRPMTTIPGGGEI